MPDIDASIPLSYKQGNVVNALGDIVNTQRGIVALQRERATLPASIAQAQAVSQTAQEQARQQHLATMRGQVSNAAQDILSLYGTGMSPDDLKQHIKDKMTNAGAQQDAINKMLADVPDDPSKIDSFIVRKAQSVLTLPEQIGSKFPAPQMVNTGQQIVPIAQGPQALTGVAPGTPIGQPTQQVLPPTTPTMIGGKPGYVGVMPQQGPGVIQSGPALGQTQAVGGTIDVINKDWADTQANASTAARNVGLLQNIIQYTPQAITGVGAERKQLLAGLAGSLGMTVEQMEKTSTDMLAKNSAMLALAGGNTDAARSLAELANPNTHMTPEAIQHAARQVMAQNQLAVIKQNYLQPYKAQADANPQEGAAAYNNALTEWNKNADPRILQLPTMSAAEKKQMMSAMPKPEQQEFLRKVRVFESHGWLK